VSLSSPPFPPPPLFPPSNLTRIPVIPPPPPPANFFCGAPYSVAYKHFRRDHMDPYNLFFHVLIMILQLTTNFAFLHQLDEDYLRADVSVWGFTHKDLSALGWVLVLLFTPSPFLAKLLSAACIYLAHYVSSSVASMDATTIWFQPFLDSLVIIYFLKKVRRAKRRQKSVQR
jgi:hypothetical protein